MSNESANRRADPVRRLNPLDQDLLSRLDALDHGLYMLVHHSQKYRSILRTELRLLRQGADPGSVRAGLERYGLVLREIKRLSREL